MSEKDLILSLTGNEYRVFSYIREMAGDNNVIIMKKEKLMQDLEMAYATMFNIIKKLDAAGIINYNGKRKRFEILEGKKTL